MAARHRPPDEECRRRTQPHDLGIGLLQCGAVRFTQNDATRCSDHCCNRTCQGLDQCCRLQRSKRFFTIFDEDLSNAATRSPLDQGIGVDDTAPEAVGDDPRHGGLAGTHQADEDHMLVCLDAHVYPSELRNDSALRTNSESESPPNFR